MAEDEKVDETPDTASEAEAEAAEEPTAEAAEEPTAEEPVAEPAAEEQAAAAAEAPADEAPADEAEAGVAEPEPEPAQRRSPDEEAEAARVAEERAQARRERQQARTARNRAKRARRTRPGAPAGGAGTQKRAPITRQPKPEHERGRRQERRGVVVSDAMEKTVVVQVDTIKAHPKYKKVVKHSTKFHAHDERSEAKIGDVVRIIETRPLSKTKRWRLVEIVEAAR
jgi:ribosomal protein uS17